MRTITGSSLLGLGTAAVIGVLVAGCPPSYFQTCEGTECGSEDAGGHEGSTDTRPRITAVTIAGNPSRSIRQGFGGAPTNRAIEVHLTGERLDGVMTVTVGTDSDALNGDISSKTSTELVFTFLVPHGAPIGSQSVKVTTPSGASTFPDAISIFAITASPIGSNAVDPDIESSGTAEHPFRSLARATTFARAGDTISIKNGIYDTAHGETFSQGATSIPADVTIQGESALGTVLVGPGATPCTSIILRALSLEGSAKIQNLGIRGFCGAIVTSNVGLVTIKSVNIHALGGAAVHAKTDVFLDSVDISEVLGDAIYSDNAKLTIAHSRIHHSGGGIYAAGGALAVTGSEIDHHCCSPLDDRPGAAAIIASGPTSLTDVTIHHNEFAGLFVRYTNSNVPLSITRSTFSATGEAINLSGMGSMRVRESTFLADNNILVHVIDPIAEIDLGTRGPDPGNNTFRICSTCDGILDGRPASLAETKPITVYGNSWHLADSAAPGSASPDCSAGDSPSGHMTSPRNWHIDHPGKCPSTGNRFFN
ncbi:DUF1565 domain-containing protein [Pendulispora brunnea]|uniref:DUF1565 domain-containing protein n=1 Tax=Pendulispora brunnea TaxID=2905690 RepID=A0ABZ2KJU2_9BACT